MENQCILVIDNNEQDVELVGNLLKFEDYEILEADNIEKGRQLARAHHPVLILIDISLLPRMD